ncbi:exonuclease [Anaerobacillus alkalidiazotrophicus]|uniref:Exonuclease n=1 Tax=Anaerobacillus alkalidiazotrophicus TaxID=472963 RepID=A0A1S2M2I5_9BACI|nr:exonuclease [Anaerobacillus alkalidiazotrophicus]
MTEVKQFIFFDFEMLCREEGMPFSNMEGIRLGAVKYDLNKEDITYFDRYIQPKQLQPLSSFCINLTKIKDEDLVKASRFPVVFQEFLNWVGNLEESRFFSWAKNDLTRLELDASIHHIPQQTITTIKSRYVDFQALFSKRVAKVNPSVENALALYNLRFEGEKHNPMYDAYNTLRIYLAFSKDVHKSDLIMLKQFIFNDQEINPLTNINTELKRYVLTDIHQLMTEVPIITNIRTTRKLVKRTMKLVKKYENIQINRSRIFDEEILLYVRLLVEFYNELLISYKEHFSNGCKIVILHEHMPLPLKRLTA